MLCGLVQACVLLSRVVWCCVACTMISCQRLTFERLGAVPANSG